jgi:hypothetical protein
MQAQSHDEQRPLLGNRFLTRTTELTWKRCSLRGRLWRNSRTVGSGVFYVVRAEVLQAGKVSSLVSRETVAGQQGRDTEAEEATGLQAVTRQRLVKTQPTEKTQCVL